MTSAMIELLISILVFVVIAAVILWCVRLVLSSFAPNPLYNLAYAIVVLILLVVFLNEIGWVGHAHAWRSLR